MTKFAPFPERFSVAGRTIVVTGGGRGLGLTFVECLAAAGANVAVIDVHEQPEAPVQDLIKSGANVKYHKYCPTTPKPADNSLTRCRCDITNRPHLKEVIGQTAKDFGAINGL
jgi:NAD(P)-dependent dehydrogenase (short-subunit alcohol dehydrogenase family)